MKDTKPRICPVNRAGSLDNRFRKWFQDPRKILGPYINEGMIVLDVGCGPGFFSIDMAQMVGKSGRVIACDIQNGMLQKLRKKIDGTELQERIIIYNSGEDRIGPSENVDFVLAFYVVHEIPDQQGFFEEIGSILRPNGQVLVAEPPFHVPKRDFEETIRKARNTGFIAIERPKIFLSQAVILKLGQQPYEPYRP